MHLVDPDIVQKLQSGSLSAFKRVYDMLSSGVYSVSFNLTKDSFMAEEVVQEVFVKLWATRESLDVEGNIWSLLYVISKRLSLNKMRDERRAREAHDNLRYFPTAEPSPEQDVFLQELQQLVECSIADLPEKQRQVIEMSRDEGLTHREIAERLGVSQFTVRNHMAQALKNLRVKLQHSPMYIYLPLVLSTEIFFKGH